MKKYLVLPARFSPENVPREKLEELHVGGPNPTNAEIVVFKRGVEWFRSPYSKHLAAMLGAKIPPLKVRVKAADGVTQRTLGGPEPAELRKGYPPIRQLLMLKCGYAGLDAKEIRKILEQLGWFEGIPAFMMVLRSDLKDLVKKDLLLKTRDGKYHAGFRGVEGLGIEGYPIEPGPYPVIRLMWDATAEHRRRTRLELVNLVYSDWFWTTSRASVGFWIRWALKRGYLREVERDVFEAGRTIGA